MAPHWKCGSGQPVAGSNPALSATAPRSDGPGRVGALCSSLTHLEVRSLRCSAPPCQDRHPEELRCRGVLNADIVPLVLERVSVRRDEPHAGEAASSSRIAVRHRGGLLLFDTGFGFGNAELDERYHPHQARRVPDALRRGRDRDGRRSTPSSTATFMPTTPGQNAIFPGIPIYVQPAEWEIAHTTDHTILDWIDFAGVALSSRSPATTSLSTASGSSRRPATRPAISRSRFDRPRSRRSRRPGLLHARPNGPATRRPRGPIAGPGSSRPTTARSSACRRSIPSRSSLRPRPRSLDRALTQADAAGVRAHGGVSFRRPC